VATSIENTLSVVLVAIVMLAIIGIIVFNFIGTAIATWHSSRRAAIVEDDDTTHSKEVDK
jgi:hypothetical protein